MSLNISLLLFCQYLNIFNILNIIRPCFRHLSESQILLYRWLKKKLVNTGSHCFVPLVVYATIAIATAMRPLLHFRSVFCSVIQSNVFNFFIPRIQRTFPNSITVADKRQKKTSGIVSISCPAIQHTARHVAVNSIDIRYTVHYISCENGAYLAVFFICEETDFEFSSRFF